MTEPARREPAREPPERRAPAPGGIAARALAGRGQPWLAGLNPEQRLAVESLDGPLLVLAGAGTGKTRVLTARIANLLASGRAFPSQILSVTFTNKAAREMKQRVGKLIGEGHAEGMPWLGTFHSIGVKILRRHAELVGLRSDFTILDTDDQIRLLKQIIVAANVDEKRWPARQFAGAIDGWKNRGLAPDKIPEGEAHAYVNGKGRELYAAYQARLKTLNAADFGDLLTECLRLFRERPDVLAEFQRRFRYMLVDEYQDTNVAQYLWLRLLAQGNRNICCVGDDDQSIYGWRGAEVDNILRFEHDFPGAQVIRLERNYRSTGHILAAASGLIAHNEGRLGKTLFTDTAELGAKVRVVSGWDSSEEARAIGEDIEQAQRRGESLNEMAILVRASFQMREFEDRFVTLGLNYRVIGGPRFYERMEIRDALAYLRATVNPADDLAFERIVNTPKRGLGASTVQLIHSHARARNVPLMSAAAELVSTEELKARPRQALGDLVRSFARWSQAVPRHAPHRSCRDDPGGIRVHRDVAAGPLRRGPRAAGKPERAHQQHGRIRVARRVPGARLARHGRRRRRGGGGGIHHDAAFRQGAGIRYGLPAGLGGRPLPAPARRRRERPRRPGGGTPACLCRPHPGAKTGSDLVRLQTAASTGSGNRRCPPASSTTCRRTTWRSPSRRAMAATAALMDRGAATACRASTRWSRSTPPTGRRAGSAPSAIRKAAAAAVTSAGAPAGSRSPSKAS